jgi:hypothetical protein
MMAAAPGELRKIYREKMSAISVWCIEKSKWM